METGKPSNEKRFSSGVATGTEILNLSNGTGRPVRCKRVLDSCRTLTEAPHDPGASSARRRASPVRTRRFSSSWIPKPAVRSRMAPVEATLLSALAVCATMQEMRRVDSLAPLTLTNSTLPPQQDPDAGHHYFKTGTPGPALGCRQAI